MTNPNDIQHGGDHYKKAGNAQHWDMLPTLGFGWEYYIGCATKYVTRIKQPDLDPKKSAHFLDKLIHLVETGAVPATFNTAQCKRMYVDSGTTPYNQRMDVESYLNTVYFPANNISPTSVEGQVVFGLMMARDVDALRAVRKLLRYLTGEAEQAEPQPDPQAEAEARLNAAMTTANTAAVSGRAVAVEGGEDTVQVSAAPSQPPQLGDGYSRNDSSADDGDGGE